MFFGFFLVAEEVAGGHVEELGERAERGCFGVDSRCAQQVADALGGDAVAGLGELPGNLGLCVRWPTFGAGLEEGSEPRLDQV
ncbi:hypothetical protein LQ51_12075 [Micromonospora sp. HK10]|nr:hypothetical protein LQ51_12075 [Micromonospora sp. HK10]